MPVFGAVILPIADFSNSETHQDNQGQQVVRLLIFSYFNPIF